VSDLIHERAELDGEDWSNYNTTQLINQVTMTEFNLKPTLDETETNIQTLQSHFMKVSDSLRGQTFWNNTARISTELFQTYFNMTISVASEVIFLENKLESIK